MGSAYTSQPSWATRPNLILLSAASAFEKEKFGIVAANTPALQSFKKFRRVSLSFGEFINNEYTPLFQRKTNSI
ncbi:MAG TPA: hypothetical protein PKZ40_05745, partial [Anaerolineaceae bacterium]|nr:hypothetical protein [Anaerolineaceae bacterium]